MTIEIRPARAGDREQCLRMIAALTGREAAPGWPATFDTLIEQSRGEILVADDGAAGLAGLATVTYNLAIRYGGEYCQLEELFVDPGARGRNLGGLLIEAVLARARTRGCAECGLYLLPHTENNRQFYEKYGFAAVGAEMRQSLVKKP